MLYKSRKTELELGETLDRIKLLGNEEEVGTRTTYTSLLTQGYISSIDFANKYRESGKLEEAKIEIRRDIRDIEHCIGKETYL
jgi:hypothetical protein